MSGLESLRPLYEAALADTADGLSARERLVEEIGRLLDVEQPLPPEERFMVLEAEEGAKHGWFGVGPSRSSLDLAHDLMRREREEWAEETGRMFIVRARTTYTLVETEEAGHDAAE